MNTTVIQREKSFFEEHKSWIEFFGLVFAMSVAAGAGIYFGLSVVVGG